MDRTPKKHGARIPAYTRCASFGTGRGDQRAPRSLCPGRFKGLRHEANKRLLMPGAGSPVPRHHIIGRPGLSATLRVEG